MEELSLDEDPYFTPTPSSSDTENTMCINQTTKSLKSLKKKQTRKSSKDKKTDVKQLLRLISNML